MIGSLFRRPGSILSTPARGSATRPDCRRFECLLGLPSSARTGVARWSLVIPIAGAGDEARAAIESEILESPLDKNQHTILEFHDVQEVNEQPDEPRGQAPKVQAVDSGNCRGPLDDGNIAFVEVVKWGQVFLAFQPGANRLRCIGAFLNRN